MPSTDTVVRLSLPRNHVGQILDGLEVLIEQWRATATCLRTDQVGDQIIRECSDAGEAERIAGFYEEIATEIRDQLGT
jgi:hypothetical protein